MRKKITAALAAFVLTLSMSGCANSKNATQEVDLTNVPEYVTDAYISNNKGLSLLEMNDYRGATLRTLCLRDLVLDKIDTMKSFNGSIRSEQPNSYWNAPAFQDFVTSFITEDIIDDLKWFTEEEFSYQHPDEWAWAAYVMEADVNNFTQKVDNSGLGSKKTTKEREFKSGVSVTRNEKDDYSVSGLEVELEGVKLLKTVSGTSRQAASYKGEANYRALYDCDKDWAKAYCSVKFKEDVLPTITAQFFEYMRVNENTFAIQTDRERLYIVLDPVETDTSLDKRTIKEFYYSKLVKEGARSSYKSFVPMSTYDPKTGKYNKAAQKYNDTMQEYAFLNDKGDVANLYGVRDSVLTRSDKTEITRDWVFEEKSLDQALVYKDGAFVATTYNKLSEQYDQFSYYMGDISDSLKNELKGLVDIEALVGILAVPETDLTVTEAVNPYNTYTIEEMEEAGLTYDKDYNVVDDTGRVIISVWDGKGYENAAAAKAARKAAIMNEHDNKTSTTEPETEPEDVDDDEDEDEDEESSEETSEILEGEEGTV